MGTLDTMAEWQLGSRSEALARLVSEAGQRHAIARSRSRVGLWATLAARLTGRRPVRPAVLPRDRSCTGTGAARTI